MTLSNKKHAVTVDFDEEQNEEEEEEVGDEEKEGEEHSESELESERNRKVQTFDEPSDDDGGDDDEVTYHAEALANITPNRLPTATPSELRQNSRSTERT